MHLSMRGSARIVGPDLSGNVFIHMHLQRPFEARLVTTPVGRKPERAPIKGLIKCWGVAVKCGSKSQILQANKSGANGVGIEGGGNETESRMEVRHLCTIGRCWQGSEESNLNSEAPTRTSNVSPQNAPPPLPPPPAPRPALPPALLPPSPPSLPPRATSIRPRTPDGVFHACPGSTFP